ncbi:MAG: hypothetical protein Q9169_001147 [Polycauliona sp. 2 TL-2023]
MADLGAETWIIHGTLMGWWWNRKIMPWDSDVDVHVSADTMEFLASYYNMTIHTCRTEHAPRGKNYMLEVNPKFVDSSPDDSLNTIDARWIDMLSGVFIDITAVHRKPKKPSMMFSKDDHHYREADLFPLRDSVFEDRPVKIPYNYAELLQQELRRLEGVVQHLGTNLDEEGEKGDGDAVDAQVDAKDKPPPTKTADPSLPKSPKEEQKIPKACGLFNGPEPRKKSVDGVAKEFGRLQVEEGRSRYVSNKFWNSLSEEIAEMRDILDDPTDDEEDYPSPGSGSSAAANNQGFIFSFSSTILCLRNFHPPPNQVLTYWDVYKENVDPLAKILHRPSTEKTLREAAKDLDHISKPLEVMMFSIYFAAVTSLSDEECINMTGIEKESALKKYRFGFEQAMARVGFLNTTELSLGLQRDGEQFGLAPFETEMRRRLWWQIVHLDLRASEDHGSEPTIIEQSFDTRFPLNIQDEDIDPSMKEPPPEREGATEMTFDLIRYSVSTTARRLSYVPPGPGKCQKRSEFFTLEHKERLIEELHQHIENKYLRHCDMNVPIHWVAGTVLRLVLAKMWLIVHHPLQREDPDKKGLSEETKDRLFRTSVEVIQWSNLLEMEQTTRKWGWLFRTYVQWHAVAFVLSQLCIRIKGPEVDQAWKVINEIFGDLGSPKARQRRGMLWKPLRNLMIRARAGRAREMEKQKAFPLDGSLGPAPQSVGATMNPTTLGENHSNISMGFDKINSSHGLPIVNTPIPNTANGLQPYLPLNEQQTQQPGIIDQTTEWMYNDPAYPITSQAFNDMNFGVMDGLAGANSDDLGDTGIGGADLNWSDWDEMMKDLPSMDQDMELEDVGNGGPIGGIGMGPGQVGGPVMGGMSNWW